MMTDTADLQLCLQHMAHAATTCPSLFAGDEQVFEAVVRTCVKIASTDALQVLASLCEVAKRRILATPTLKQLFLNDVLRLCAEYCVTGVDDDVEDWASEPATIMVSQWTTQRSHLVHRN